MSVTFDFERLDRAERLLAHLPGALHKALPRVMNRALTGGRAAVAKHIRRLYRVLSRNVKATMEIHRATRGQLRAAVVSRGQRIPLFAFGAKPDQPGTGGPGKPALRVTVRKRGGKKPVAGAFVASAGWVARRKGKERTPLAPLFGPAIPQMLANPEIVTIFNETAQTRLDDRLDHEIDWAVKKADR